MFDKCHYFVMQDHVYGEGHVTKVTHGNLSHIDAMVLARSADGKQVFTDAIGEYRTYFVKIGKSQK